MYETTPKTVKYAEYLWILVPLGVVLILLFGS